MLKQNTESDITKILIIRLSSIGDIVLTSPAIRLLKKRFPKSEIDFIVKSQFADLIKNHPCINHVYTFDKNKAEFSLKSIKRQIKKRRYDLIIDLHKNFRSFYLCNFPGASKIVRYKKFSLRRFLFVKFKINLFKDIIPIHQRYLIPLKNLGIVDDGKGLDIFVPDETHSRIEERYRNFFSEDFDQIIGIIPGASYFTKRWLPEYFARVIDHLATKQQTGIILFGDQKDRELIVSLNIKGYRNLLNAAGELSLLESVALLDKCQLVITNDSGLMHIAAALNKKIVAIFGSTTKELGFFPVAKNVIVLENDNLKCRPCSHVGRNHCPKNHFKCMTEITPESVIKAVEGLGINEFILKR